MLLQVLLALAPLAPLAGRTDDPPVKVRLSHEQFQVGDRGKIYFKTDRDGYVAILHADPQGRVRVLFPIDPTEDNFVRGGKQVELRGRSDRDALQIDAGGTGTVLAIYSADAFTFDELTRNGHWDFAALGGPDESVKNDPLAGLLEIANNMARDHQFDYDVATYVVYDDRYAASGDDYGNGHSHFGIGLAFGYPYPFGIGFAFGYPYYSPFGFVPFWGWYGYGYGYGYPYSYGYRYPVYPPYAPVVYTGGFVTGFSRKGTGIQNRFTPIQPRPRGGFTQPTSLRGSDFESRVFEPRNRSIEPRARSVEPRSRNISPRGATMPSRNVSPRANQSRMSFGASRPSFTRSFGGVSRSFGGFGGSRGGFTGTRRH